MPIRRKTLQEYFQTRVQIGDGCWLWQGLFDGVGYGKIVLHRHAKAIGAHKASWQMHHCQTVPAGMHVCHHCDTPACVRPSHLFIGTPKDNQRDAQRKGRLSVPGKGWLGKRTHCPKGHAFDEKNTYWATKPNGKKSRMCRPCHAANEDARRRRMRAVA